MEDQHNNFDPSTCPSAHHESEPLTAGDSDQTLDRDRDPSPAPQIPHPSQVINISGHSEGGCSMVAGNLMSREVSLPDKCDAHALGKISEDKSQSDVDNQKKGRFFYYDSPLNEETGIWIPVSLPPMSESDHEEWRKGIGPNGGYFPEEDMGWNQFVGEEKELTMWDVAAEMLIAARGKMSTLASGELQRCRMSWVSAHLLEQAWNELAQTLTEANMGTAKEIIEAEAPKWLPDSAASSCMLCWVRFHPIMCSRHHCRFCGGIFCGDCSRGRSLLPVKFRKRDPQRVCDVCCVRLESLQPYLMDQVSHAAQLPTHDLTDLSTLRSWLNFPCWQSMEYEIYKATNTIQNYCQGSSSLVEKMDHGLHLLQYRLLALDGDLRNYSYLLPHIIV